MKEIHTVTEIYRRKIYKQRKRDIGERDTYGDREIKVKKIHTVPKRYRRKRYTNRDREI